ncbi:hypothetical protein [Rubritalea tangerina]|uniref:hypothetical protein n=1 Tax=Rubritalea tangerina TaxID=430798 RepID=UPI00360A2DBF
MILASKLRIRLGNRCYEDEKHAQTRCAQWYSGSYDSVADDGCGDRLQRGGEADVDYAAEPPL